MAELLAQLWSWAAMPFQDPRIAAAAPAFVVSWLIGNRNTALVCAIIAFCTINLIIYLSGIPANGAFQLPVEAAAGVGAGMALMGVHGMQERVTQLNFKTFLSSIADTFRGKK